MCGLEREGDTLVRCYQHCVGWDIELCLDWKGRGRLSFDGSSTVLGAILKCEWIGKGGGDSCLMLAALCCV